MDTTQHVSFYLFVLQQLAFPNSITSLFPTSEEVPLMVQQAVLPEVTKAVFRWAGVWVHWAPGLLGSHQALFTGL